MEQKYMRNMRNFKTSSLTNTKVVEIDWDSKNICIKLILRMCENFMAFEAVLKISAYFDFWIKTWIIIKI